MHLRIAICINKKIYADRLYTFWDKYYKDKLEVNLFYDLQYLNNYLEKNSLDFVLFGQEWKQNVEINKEKYPVYAYLVEQLCYQQDEEPCMEIKMYQRGDRLYRDLIGAYASAGQIRKEVYSSKEEKALGKILLFLSVGGGTGASSVAEAYVRRCAKAERVLKLDMQFCSGREEENEHGMDEILFALKSRRYILPLKLEAKVKISDDKVSSFSLCSNPMDLLNITKEEMRQLIDTINHSAHFDKIIIDMDSVLGEKEKALIEKADRIICVVDDSDSCLNKFKRFYKALAAIEQITGISIRNKLYVFQNRYQGGERESYYAENVLVCGNAPKYLDAPWKDIVYTIESNANFYGI